MARGSLRYRHIVPKIFPTSPGISSGRPLLPGFCVPWGFSVPCSFSLQVGVQSLLSVVGHGFSVG